MTDFAIPQPRNLSPQQIKVLVIDDEMIISSLIEIILNSAGIEHIDLAENGLTAIEMLKDADPIYDLILCDLNMPVKNGLDVHDAMRSDKRYTKTCFMLVTGVTDASQIDAAMANGIDDYTVKPINKESLLQKIAKHFPKVKN